VLDIQYDTFCFHLLHHLSSFALSSFVHSVIVHFPPFSHDSFISLYTLCSFFHTSVVDCITTEYLSQVMKPCFAWANTVTSSTSVSLHVIFLITRVFPISSVYWCLFINVKSMWYTLLGEQLWTYVSDGTDPKDLVNFGTLPLATITDKSSETNVTEVKTFIVNDVRANAIMHHHVFPLVSSNIPSRYDNSSHQTWCHLKATY
jgi:hypothetical protein